MIKMFLKNTIYRVTHFEIKVSGSSWSYMYKTGQEITSLYRKKIDISLIE